MVKKKPLPGWSRQNKPDTNYYVMDCYHRTGDAEITEEPDLPPEIDNWMGGVPLAAAPPEPMIFVIEPDDEGDLLPFFNGLIPLMSSDLISALKEGGVDNLDTHPAVIREIGSGKDGDQYMAVNIIGAVRAADMTQSDAEDPGMAPDGLMTVFFDSLVLDESVIHGQLLFRLAEALSAVIVHKSVRDHLLAKGFDRLDFVHPTDWSG